MFRNRNSAGKTPQAGEGKNKMRKFGFVKIWVLSFHLHSHPCAHFLESLLLFYFHLSFPCLLLFLPPPALRAAHWARQPDRHGKPVLLHQQGEWRRLRHVSTSLTQVKQRNRRRAAGASHNNPRTPNVHIWGPGASKHHQNSTRRPPERQKKSETVAGKGRKSAKFWASHPFGAPPFGDPLFQVWPPPFGAPPFGAGLARVGQLRLAKLGQIFLAKVGLAKVGIGQSRPIKMAKVGLAKVGRSQNLRVFWKLMKPQACVWEIRYRITMKTILQEKVRIHYSTTIWLTSVNLCLKQWKFLQQKQRWTRNGKNWRKFRRGTWQKSEVNQREVITEARMSGATVHFASLMDTCHLKNDELEAKHQKYKGRVVLRGDVVEDDSGSHAVFTEQGFSASQMTAVKNHGYHLQIAWLRWTSSRRSIS